MYTIRLEAVDSRYATAEELRVAGITEAQIPVDENSNHWQLASHQVQTIRALKDETGSSIIINQAMTGDGKTLAGRFQLLSQGKNWRTFAMYPTNELAYDQVQSFDELLGRWHPPAWQRTLRKRLINAQEIDDFSYGDDISSTRLEEIKGMLRADYILTNPDIFHLIMNFTYQQQGIASDILPTYLADRFSLFVFDEFHLFGIEQTASVLIAMLLLKYLAGEMQAPRFLFLSATPQKMLTQLASLAQLDFEEPIKGYYENGCAITPVGYRRILQESQLTLHTGKLEDWIQTQFDSVIKPFFLENQGAAKGLIIANSVASAHRIYAYLEQLCSGAGIKPGINTGLTPKADRSRQFDLLVATSTVDVGVDFKINFLVFESRDAASHIQRLGRLGRHKNNSNGQPFQTYEAHALLPQWTVDGLMQSFGDGDAVSRKEYKAILEQYFAPTQQFDEYVYRWAGVQAGQLLMNLYDRNIRSQYNSLRQDLERDFKLIFSKKGVNKYFALAKDRANETIKTAASFRGSSPFTALVQDLQTDSQQVMTYNLMSLLRRGELRAISVEDMLKEARKRHQNVDSLSKTNPLVAYRLIGWRDDYQDVTIKLDVELPSEYLEVVFEQDGFTLDCVGIPELQGLNDELYSRKLVTFIIPDKDPDLIRRLLRLGFQTDLLKFSAPGKLQGTIVFGRDALLIDSVLKRRKAQSAFFW